MLWIYLGWKGTEKPINLSTIINYSPTIIHKQQTTIITEKTIIVCNGNPEMIHPSPAMTFIQDTSTCSSCWVLAGPAESLNWRTKSRKKTLHNCLPSQMTRFTCLLVYATAIHSIHPTKKESKWSMIGQWNSQITRKPFQLAVAPGLSLQIAAHVVRRDQGMWIEDSHSLSIRARSSR